MRAIVLLAAVLLVLAVMTPGVASADADWEGSVTVNGVRLVVEGGRVHQGRDILFTLEGNRVFAGPNTTGTVLFYVTEDRVFAGANASGPILYEFFGKRILDVYGNPVGALKGDTFTHKLLAPILLEMY